MDTTQLSIIQPRFMPLFGSLQRGITQLSIIQPRFMPLLNTLQSQSKLLSIIQPHFMPLIGSLQRESTQLSIIHTCFMLIPFTLRESLSYPPIAIWVSTLFIKNFSNSVFTLSNSALCNVESPNSV